MNIADSFEQPKDPIAEKAVLGAILIAGANGNKDAIDLTFNMLSPQDFYIPFHANLFGYMQGLHEDGLIIDELILHDKFPKQADEIGRMMLDTPGTANIEAYCQIVLDRAAERKALLTMEDVVRGVQAGDGQKISKRLEAGLEKIASEAPEAGDPASAVDKEIEAEISGQRFAVKFPGMPCLSSTKALLPGTITVLCGSAGASKSLMLLEWIWRISFAGIPAAVMELEKGAAFHIRRALAQLCECAHMTNDVWIKGHVEEARDFLMVHRAHKERLHTEGIVQAPSKRPDCTTLLRWISQECQKGKRVLAIDPINAMQGKDQRFLDQERFIGEAGNILTRYGSSLIVVIHPADGMRGEKILPSLQNVQGSKSFRQFVDTVLWLEAHENQEENFPTVNEYGFPNESAILTSKREPVSYNRTLHLLKVRLAAGGGRRIAVSMNSDSLWHAERGWL